MTTHASSDVAKRNKLLHMINKEIKTIKQIKNRGPNLEFRLLELYTENLKIIKEVENSKFLKNKNPKLKKRSFFTQSIKLNKKVESLGLYITKRWKNYRSNASIYYTLALNERDFNSSKKTEYYLIKSLRTAPNGSPIVHSIKTTLAEMYYNDKKYSKAVRFYKDVIINMGDEWYAKHHYNYAWCLLKTKRLASGLDHMLKAFAYSKNPRYVSVESQVLDAISIFYIQNDKIPQGTEFYITKVDEPAEYMTKFATRAQTTKKYEEVNTILDAGVQNAITKKQNSELVHYYNYELEFYRTYKKLNKHLAVSKKLTELYMKNHLKGEDLDESIQKIKSYVGFLQIQLSKNLKINIGDYDQNLLASALSYFDHLMIIDSKSKDQYLYFQGETLFSVGEFKRAYGKYARALEDMKKRKVLEQKIAKKNKVAPKYSWDDVFAKKVINALLASLQKFEEYNLSNVKYKTYVYSNHVNLWPKDEKSRLIYPKLFSIYFTKKSYDKSIVVIKEYHKNFPKDVKAQKGMFAKVFDHYVAIKDIPTIASLIQEFNKGFLSYEPQYIKKATIILANLLFNKIDKQIELGDTKSALAEYNKILENKNYPNKIHTQATFRSALIYVKALNTKQSYKLITKSYKMDKTNEMFKQVDVIDNIINEFALAQDFNRALSLSYRTLHKFCKDTYKTKTDMFKKSIHYSLIENNMRAVDKINKLAQKCKINSKSANPIVKDHLNIMALEGKIAKLQTLKKIYPTVVSSKIIAKAAENKYWYYRGEGNNSKSQEMFKIMKDNYSTSIISIEQYEQLDRELNKLSFNFTTDKFDGELFNSEIEKTLNSLKEITKKSQDIQKHKHPIITPRVSILISKQYDKATKSISSFKPFGFNKQETDMFKQQISPLIATLDKEKSEFSQAAVDTIRANTIFSYDNHSHGKSTKTKANILKRYPASMLSLSLDLQGAQ